MPAASENIDCQNNSETEFEKEFEEDNHLITALCTHSIVDTHKVHPALGHCCKKDVWKN